MHSHDTIVALATAAGPAARLIVRSSGPAAFELATQVGVVGIEDRRATPVMLGFANLSVRATCYAFQAPRSHTGEDIVEYHLPGNALLGRLLIESLVTMGARQAQPGEFSARAFFNGKLRLDEAEGVAALIGASNDRELAAARRLRAGELARRLAPAMEELADLLAMTELGIDFTEEDVVVLEPADAQQRIATLCADLNSLLEQAPRLEQLGRPPRVALVGWPNAGKSTLMNALAGCRRAVASHRPGTTRDALTAEINLPGGRITLIDLAGLGQTAGLLDAEGGRRALAEAAIADVLVLVRDVADDRADPPLPRPADLRVLTKADLRDSKPGDGELPVSALTGQGLDELRRRLGEVAFTTHAGGEALALGARHREQIAAALEALEQATAVPNPGDATELLALHLREALNALGAILGTVSPDDLLGRIFGRFCIGK